MDVSLRRYLAGREPRRAKEGLPSIVGGDTPLPDAQSYVELVLEKYHRYVLPQLRIFKKVQEQYTKHELTDALSYCIEHDLYSANDFYDTLVFFAQPKLVKSEKRGELPAKYSSVQAQTRSVSVYGQLTSSQRASGTLTGGAA